METARETLPRSLALLDQANRRQMMLLGGSRYEVELLRKMARDLDRIATAVERRGERALEETSCEEL
ncbi:MAG: hypothetical protein ABFD89_29520 [Bryobacteraceae bacterium]